MNHSNQGRRLFSRYGIVTGVLLSIAHPGTLAQTGTNCAAGGTNLVGWWPGDDHTYNVVNQRAATVQGTVTYVPGVAGNAFEFNGNGKVRIAEATSIDLSRTNRWTIAAWVKPANLDTAASPTIYSEGNRVASLGLQKGTGKLESWINGANLLESSVTVPVNQWSHVAIVLDRAARTLYVNGAATGTASGTPAVTPDSSGSAIGGAAADDASTAFGGDIDEITIHRRALSAEEIAAIHAAGSAGLCYGNGGVPTFVIEPQPQTVALFGDASFAGLALGSPRPTYQWLFNDAPLAGQTNFTLALTKVTSTNDGVYKLVAVSGTQRTISAGARLTVQHCVETPAGLVAWWPADGNGLEFTGEHSGEVWNGVAFPSGVAGQAFGFDGASAYVAVPDSPALSPHAGANGELTVEAWVNLPAMPLKDTVTGEDRRFVLAKGDPGRYEYDLSITTAGVPQFFVYSPNGSGYATLSAGQLLLNQWHHLVGTLKKGQYLRLYQDGQLMAETTAFTGDTSDNGAPLYIGRRGDALFFAGLVDEPAIYNRALDGTEISALYTGGSAGKCYGGGPKPIFVQEPRDQDAFLLNSVTLEAMAMGTPRPTYQWYHGATPIQGATNAALTLIDLRQADAGQYLLVASNLFGAAQSRLLTLTLKPFESSIEGFELGWDGWTSDDSGVWQVGQPTSGPGAAHTGVNCAATVLGGKYPGDANTRLTSPVFVVPAAGQNPRLRFWHWIESEPGYDLGAVEIREVGSGNWTELGRYSGYSLGGWARPSLDLGAFAGKKVQLALHFWSNGWTLEYAGWYVDDLEIETGDKTFPLPQGIESFESGLEGWDADYGVWQVGQPTSGPGAAHTGVNCAATVLGGKYPGDANTRLTSPVFVVPAAGQNPRLRFWHWIESEPGYDLGAVEIREVGSGNWTELGRYSGYSLGGWARPSLDLGAFAGKKVQLALHFWSNGWTLEYAGWYVDDLEIETGDKTFPLPQGIESFESGLEGWDADYGVWQVGQPTSGPGAAHTGVNCAATVLGGKYPGDANTRLTSPVFVVPAAGQNPRLRFWHWIESEPGYDLGAVEIREVGSGNWTELGRYSGYSLGGWARPSLDLGAFAGKKVQLALHFWSNGWTLEYAGWYVDDLEIETGDKTFPLPQGIESFESGLEGWDADYGVWQVGQPTSGPGAAHTGVNCAATVLGGKYPGDANTRLTSPVFVVPAAGQNPRLRFWHWIESEPGYDLGAVEIREVGSGNWVELGRYSGYSLGGWARPSLDLGAFAGKKVQLALHFWSNGWTLEYAGWYVDDLLIQVGAISIAEVPDQIVNEKVPLSFKVNAIGANEDSSLTFTLPWAPEGAWIDPETGVFTWTPSERQGPGVYNIPVIVVDYGNDEAKEMTTVKITVNEVNEPPWLHPAVLAIEPGQALHFPLPAGDRDFPKNPLKFDMTDAPAGSTLTADTGVLEWAVPANAQPATYIIKVTLSDNGTPNYTTNNTLTLTVTTNATYGLSVRFLGASDLEFTIHDAAATDDYILQGTTALVDHSIWTSNAGNTPAWVATLPEDVYLEWLSWEEFAQQALQPTPWQDMVRVSPAQMPYSFVHKVADITGQPMGLFRLVRVHR